MLAETSRLIGANGDLVAYHFDNGVPWVEALADTFASAEPPYSANVREVWAQERAARPAGTKVAVAINPLGVPRNSLAPYWGVGQGFYHDDRFNLVGTGVVQDYESRLLPHPWNTYALDSPQVKTAFLNYARRTLDYFRPDYLITGVEVNLALQADPVLFARYVELQRYVYTQLRANPAYAHVKIGVSVAAEYFVADEFGVPVLADAMQGSGVAEGHLNGLRALLPYTDLVGLSVYPVKTRFGTSQIQAGFFDTLFSTLRSVTDKPLAITEAGYPSSTFQVQNLHFSSSRETQFRFLRLMLSESAKHGLEFVTNYSVRDQTPYMDKLRARSLEVPPFISPRLVEFYKYFEFIGVFEASGEPKPSASLFASTLEVPLSLPDRFAAPIRLNSPDGLVQAVVAVAPDGRLTYSLDRSGRAVLESSPLGITVDGADLGRNIIGLELRATTIVDETYPTRGAHSTARNHAIEFTLEIHRTGAGDRMFSMVWRLYDEGLAFRYVIPGIGARTISGEASGWTIPDGSPVWHQLSTSNYEGTYFKFPIGHFNTTVGAPLTIELSTGAGYLTLTEGALRDYSGMTYDADLGSRLIKAQFQDDATWQVAGGASTPWRLAIASATLDGLVNADMTTHVSPAPDPVLFPKGLRTGWIRPGKAVWSWWTDNESGADWELQKRYVDYATRLRAEYVTVDAWWETGFPTDAEDQFQRLGNLVAYAHTQQRFVGIWVWRSWFSMIDRTARRTFLQRVRDAGAVGVKIDNLDDTRTESIANVRVYEEMLRDAAEFQLMLNFHGLHKPTGLERTYPNLMAQESLAGLEYTSVQWAAGGTIPVVHNATVPFVRYVAGPADYTPVTFDARKIGESTFAHQLATAGVFTSPLLHYADDPALLLAQPHVQDVLRTLPTVWDETIVLPQSRIGELAAIARRSGERWYLFVLNGRAGAAASLQDLPLSFLGNRPYNATLIGDGTKTTFERRQIAGLRSIDTVDIAMLAGGGFTGVFIPAPDPSRPVGQGFSSIPPANTGAGWQAGYGWIRDHGNVIAHSLQEGIPWPEALLSSDYRSYSAHLKGFWELMRSADIAAAPGHARYLMINPIETVSYARLAPYHGERDYMPLPAPWDTYEFNDPRVKTAMLNYLIAAIDYFQPAYVATSIEANILLANAPHKWNAFKELNAYLYTTLKARYPHLKVFTTLHYEHMLGLAEESRTLALTVRNSYPNVLEAEVKDLMRHSDYVAVSTYPFMMENNRYIGPGGRVDFDYFDRAVAIARELDKPMVFEQTGYISENLYVANRGVTLPGSEALQDDYLKLVLGVAHTENVDFAMNFVVGDYGKNYGELPTVLTWAHTGLFREDGSAKPALATWDAYRVEAGGTPVPPDPPPALEGLARLFADAARTGVPAGIESVETPPSPELFVRWQQFASLLPGFQLPPGSDPTSPWGFADPYAAAARATLIRREQFLPYLEPLLRAYDETGVFALRLLPPAGAPTFMLGDWVLVAPVVEPGASTRTLTLPADTGWTDWYSGQQYAPGQTIVVDAPLDRMPLFVRRVSAGDH
ncbi:MAG: glycoside hydrolase family 97 catalytic domain-containing protein [Chloroflexota bacterium]|nr:glycoside hydrolase family 97 catalytic domain-containing protein [Chloroflexota bacterium]